MASGDDSPLSTTILSALTRSFCFSLRDKAADELTSCWSGHRRTRRHNGRGLYVGCFWPFRPSSTRDMKRFHWNLRTSEVGNQNTELPLLRQNLLIDWLAGWRVEREGWREDGVARGAHGRIASTLRFARCARAMGARVCLWAARPPGRRAELLARCLSKYLVA